MDISMTISDLLFETGISTQTADQSASIIQTVLRQNINNDAHDDVQFNRNIIEIEKDILEKIIEKCNLTEVDVHKIQQIIQVCFKNYYFREKEYTMKVGIFFFNIFHKYLN